MAQYRNFCFTAWPRDNLSVEVMRSRMQDGSYRLVQRMKYCVFQQETSPTTQRLHIQGYFEAKPSVTAVMIREVFGGDVHIENKKGTRNQARAYCMKDDTRVPGTEPEEFGRFVETQGKRNDLEAAISTLREHGLDAARSEHPAVWVKYSRGLRELARHEEGPARDEHFEPRAWQATVVAALGGEPDDRTIFWVTDAVGGKGKSRLARHLVANHGGLCLSGRLADMAHILGGALESAAKPRIAIFDVSRAAAENVQHLYSFAEMVKNGLVVSTKYDSRQLVFEPLHCIFFSNSTWDRTKFSLDRVREMNLAYPPEQQIFFP